MLAVDVEKQLGALKLAVRFDAARGASHSEASSAANASTIAIRTSLPAAASPPGTWVKV